MSYQITEPHPTAIQGAYMHTGRGGAGNMFKIKSTSSSSTAPRISSASTRSGLRKIPTSATASSSSSTKSSRVSTGRGGAANIKDVDVIREFSFEEEMALQSKDERREVWHVGRGGAGNWGSKKVAKSERKLSNESSGSESAKSGFLGRLSGAFSRE